MCSHLVLRDMLFSVCNGFHFDPGMTRIELSSLGVFNLLTRRKRNLVIFEWLFENVSIREQLHQKKCGRLLVVSWNWYFLAQAAQLRLRSQPGVTMRINSCQWAVSGSGTCTFHLTSSKEMYLSRITPLDAFPLAGVQNVNNGSNYLDEGSMMEQQGRRNLWLQWPRGAELLYQMDRLGCELKERWTSFF